MDKKDIASYNLEELIQEMKTLGEKPFRARQIYAWLHQKPVSYTHLTLPTNSRV